MTTYFVSFFLQIILNVIRLYTYIYPFKHLLYVILRQYIKYTRFDSLNHTTEGLIGEASSAPFDWVSSSHRSILYPFMHGKPVGTFS